MSDIQADIATTGQTVPAEEPKAAKKARAAPHRADVAPTKAKSAKKASPAKTAAKREKSAKAGRKANASRPESKTAKVLGLLKRSGGATLKELTKATGWQAHSVRGFLSGALGKKMGMTVTSTRPDVGERRYSVKG